MSWNRQWYVIQRHVPRVNSMAAIRQGQQALLGRQFSTMRMARQPMTLTAAPESIKAHRGGRRFKSSSSVFEASSVGISSKSTWSNNNYTTPLPNLQTEDTASSSSSRWRTVDQDGPAPAPAKGSDLFYSPTQRQVMEKCKQLHASIMPLNEKVRRLHSWDSPCEQPNRRPTF